MLAPELTLGASATMTGGGKWAIANAAGRQVLADLQLSCGALPSL